MKLYYLFSRNEKIGSKLISRASGLLVKDLEKIPSHIAMLLEFDNIEELFVAESTLESGVRIIPYSVWLQHNELCYKIPCSESIHPNKVFEIFNTIWGKKYDWPGIGYFAICFVKHLLFRIDFPKENKWQSDDKFFCSEAISTITNYTKAGMATPAKMCSDFLKMRVQNG